MPTEPLDEKETEVLERFVAIANRLGQADVSRDDVRFLLTQYTLAMTEVAKLKNQVLSLESALSARSKQ